MANAKGSQVREAASFSELPPTKQLVDFLAHLDKRARHVGLLERPKE